MALMNRPILDRKWNDDVRRRGNFRRGRVGLREREIPGDGHNDGINNKIMVKKYVETGVFFFHVQHRMQINMRKKNLGN